MIIMLLVHLVVFTSSNTTANISTSISIATSSVMRRIGRRTFEIRVSGMPMRHDDRMMFVCQQPELLYLYIYR